MSRSAMPQPTLFLSPLDRAVLDAAQDYVFGPADGRKAQRRHALVRAVRDRWWALRHSPVAKRRANIMGGNTCL